MGVNQINRKNRAHLKTNKQTNKNENKKTKQPKIINTKKKKLNKKRKKKKKKKKNSAYRYCPLVPAAFISVSALKILVRMSQLDIEASTEPHGDVGGIFFFFGVCFFCLVWFFFAKCISTSFPF